MQIDQDPGDYRYQKADGTWQNRVNRKLCRWLGAAGLVFVLLQAWRFGTEGGEPIIVIGAALFGFMSGALIMLSFRPTD